MVQQVASQRVALLALEVERQLQDLHQVRAVGQDLVAVHASDLLDKRHRKQRYRREVERKAEPGDDTGTLEKGVQITSDNSWRFHSSSLSSSSSLRTSSSVEFI